MASLGNGPEMLGGSCLTCIRHSVECTYDDPPKVRHSSRTSCFTAYARAGKTDKSVRSLLRTYLRRTYTVCRYVKSLEDRLVSLENLIREVCLASIIRLPFLTPRLW